MLGLVGLPRSRSVLLDQAELSAMKNPLREDDPEGVLPAPMSLLRRAALHRYHSQNQQGNTMVVQRARRAADRYAIYGLAGGECG